MSVHSDEVCIKPVPIVGRPTEKPDGFQILLAIDQLANALTGGWADETMSSRTYRNREVNSFWKFAHKFINTLFFFQPNHCYEAYMSEVNGTQQDPALRNNIAVSESEDVSK